MKRLVLVLLVVLRAANECYCTIFDAGLRHSIDDVNGSHTLQDANLKFSWKSCGKPSDLIKITSLDIAPNGSIYLVTGNGKVAETIESPIQADIKMMRWVLAGWLPIPCIDEYGSCSYPNICSMSPYNDSCPKPFTDNQLPCRCPIPQGKYLFKNFPVNLNILPKWLEKGQYEVIARLKWNDKQLLCLKMNIGL